MMLALFLFLLPKLGLADHALKSIQDSPALTGLLEAVASAHSKGPNFNSFYYSDQYSLFVIESRSPKFSWVQSEEITKHLDSLIKKALVWVSAEEKDFIKEKKLQAMNDLKQILNSQKFKRYSETNQRGTEYRLESYYISDDYQLWFEEIWVD